MEGFREACTTSSGDNFQRSAVSLLERNLKRVDFTNKEAMHKKINKKDVYVDYGIPEEVCSLIAVWKFDNIKFK